MAQYRNGRFPLEAEERKPVISYSEMQDYCKTLYSFSGEDMPNTTNPLRKGKIHYPRSLYKYHPV